MPTAPTKTRQRARGKLKIGDDWNAITIIALSQSIDFDLLAAAVEQSQDESQLRVSSSEILSWVRSMPEPEKDSLLARIIEDDVSHPDVAWRQRAFSELRPKYAATVGSAPRRTPAKIFAKDPCSCGGNCEGSTQKKA